MDKLFFCRRNFETYYGIERQLPVQSVGIANTFGAIRTPANSLARLLGGAPRGAPALPVLKMLRLKSTINMKKELLNAVVAAIIRGPSNVTVKPLPPGDAFHVSAADGWLDLGNHIEAAACLEQIAPEFRAHPEVLKMRARVITKGGTPLSRT